MTRLLAAQRLLSARNLIRCHWESRAAAARDVLRAVDDACAREAYATAASQRAYWTRLYAMGEQRVYRVRKP